MIVPKFKLVRPVSLLNSVDLFWSIEKNNGTNYAISVINNGSMTVECGTKPEDIPTLGIMWEEA